jgi:hypothetical protein
MLPQMGMYILENGNLFAFYYSRGSDGALQKVYGGLFGPDLNKIKDLLEYDVSKPVEEYDNIFILKPVAGVSKTAIYVAQPRLGNDISVYDFDGRLIRKLRMPVALVEMTADHRSEMMTLVPKGDKQFRKIKFPRFFPPYLTMFTDDNDRLYVAGFEKDKSTGTTVCDIFTPEGVRILRAGIGYCDLAHLLFGTQYYQRLQGSRRLFDEMVIRTVGDAGSF